MLKNQGKLEDATHAYRQAIKNSPSYSEAYNNLGIVLNDQGKLEEAIEAYKKASSLKPGYADIYNNMGVALQEKKNQKN